MGQKLTDQGLQEAWSEAVRFWNEQLLLSFPVLKVQGDAIAFINLETRQVFVNLERLHSSKVEHCAGALFAHEIGHHVHWPHTLRQSADLQLIGVRLVPHFSPVYLNLFYDLLINERVGTVALWRQQLVDTYKAFSPRDPDGLFTLYLAIYEALWEVPGAILRGAVDDRVRQNAEAFRQTFFGLSSLHEQFVFFCGVFMEHFLEAVSPQARQWQFSDIAGPDAEDFPGDMQPSAAGRRALAKGEQSGWIPVDRTTGTGQDPFEVMRRLGAGQPGTQAAAFVECLADRLYAHQINRVIAGLPTPTLPAPSGNMLPVNLDEWDYGDDVNRIDWVSSVIWRGPLAVINPLQREWIADADGATARGMPRVEIYLDTSGSMPDPRSGLNCMTLAAQVLAAYAIRLGAVVKGEVYSAGPVRGSDWMRSETAARRFFFHYAGGGTDFPFAVLSRNTEESPEALRVIISDGDFVHNLNELVTKHKMQGEFLRDVARSVRLVLLLLGVAEKTIREKLQGHWHPHLQVLTVDHPSQLAPMSGLLARTLLGGEA